MIFCFSACGNTALVATKLAEILRDRVVRINSVAEDSFNVAGHKFIIWAFPVYSWGVPTEVRRFIKNVRLDGGDGIRHFMVATCGDDAGLTASMWRKELKKRGWIPRAAHTVIMPNTYVSLPGFDVDSAGVVTDKLKRMPERVKEVAHAIKCNSPVDSVVKGKFAWLKTRIIYPMFMRFLTSAGPFRSADSCSSCGLCSKVCPMGNISIVNGSPKWADRCTMCLGCYHHCPHNLISYGGRTKGKGQYVAPKSL